MAAYRRAYDSLHLQADCQEPGSTPEPYARQSSMGYVYVFTCKYRVVSCSHRISFLDCGRCTWFERISMAVILLNCVTLGMFQPCDDIVCSSLRCRILEAFDHAIFVFFAAEMCVKVCAMGLFGKRAYLGDTWNRLDLFIVVAGYPLLYCSVSFCPKPPSRIVFPVKP